MNMPQFMQRIAFPILLILAAFMIGFLFPYRASAQDGDCPTGTIGNCTELEVISSRCSGTCLILDDPIGWYAVSCKKTVYQCTAPQVKRYTTGECGASCTFNTE